MRHRRNHTNQQDDARKTRSEEPSFHAFLELILIRFHRADRITQIRRTVTDSTSAEAAFGAPTIAEPRFNGSRKPLTSQQLLCKSRMRWMDGGGWHISCEIDVEAVSMRGHGRLDDVARRGARSGQRALQGGFTQDRNIDDNEVRVIDVKSAMHRRRDNTITLVPRGRPGDSADVSIGPGEEASANTGSRRTVSERFERGRSKDRPPHI